MKFSGSVKSTKLDGKIVRSKSSKDVKISEASKVNGNRRSVFGACIGRPFDEVN